MRVGGIILFMLFLVPTILAFVLTPFGILWNPVRMKEAVRAIDEFNNAFWLNGFGRESVSSHCGRVQSTWWARFVIRLTDALQKGHCKEANKNEQPVVDFINNLG